MNNFLLFLRRKMAPFLESKLFAWLFGIGVFVNPIAMAPQLWEVIASPSIEGVATETYAMIAVLQMLFVCCAIQQVDENLSGSPYQFC